MAAVKSDLRHLEFDAFLKGNKESLESGESLEQIALAWDKEKDVSLGEEPQLNIRDGQVEVLSNAKLDRNQTIMSRIHSSAAEKLDVIMTTQPKKGKMKKPITRATLINKEIDVRRSSDQSKCHLG